MSHIGTESEDHKGNHVLSICWPIRYTVFDVSKRAGSGQGPLGRIAMTRFHFHLWDGEQLVRDVEGVELSELSTARERALMAARDVLAGEVREGRLPLNMRLDVEDDARNMVHQLHFRDVIQILH